MPTAFFEGEVIIVDTPEKAEEAVQWLSLQSIVGVDTEARPSFKRGLHYPTALVQIATHERCYLFRLTHVGLPQSLADFFANPKIRKVGLAFKDDLNGLRKRRNFVPANCIDIQSIVRMYGIFELGLQKLFAICFGKKISKAQQLTNWENSHLTEEQARYASTDAWATLLIYEDLMAHEPLDSNTFEVLAKEEKEKQIEHQQEIQDQRLREQGIEPPPHLTPEEREAKRAQKKREARKRKRHNQHMKRLSLFIAIMWMIAVSATAQAKYVFYFIGDGMGANQVLAAEMYRSALEGKPLGRTQTIMTQFPYSGQVATFSKSNGITDSAAAGTCLATGTKTTNGTLGLNEKGDTLRTIAEELKADGWGIGIMTTVAIDHATPAAFYGHDEKRSHYYEIGTQLCYSNFDFFGGAGFHYPEGKKDDKGTNLYRLAEQRGYSIAHGYNEAQTLMKECKKMILVQETDDQGAKHGDNLKYTIDQTDGDLTLAQIVKTATPFLEQKYDRFFMMVEGGMIDYACHGDDGRTAIEEVWNMDEAMQYALDFYNAHPDETLIIVTADHETGGLALGNSDYTLNLDLLQYQKCSAWILSDKFSTLFKENKKPSWNAVKNLYREQLGLWDKIDVNKEEETELKALYKATLAHKSKDTKTMYKTINQLSNAGVQLLNKRARVGWTSWAHTASAVPVFAIGVGAERFCGWHDNTEIVPLIKKAIAE